MKIGIFDSGIGGTTIFHAVKKELKDAEYFYLADSKNCPYGEKSDAELKKIVTANVEKLKSWGASIIVIACNTATVKCIDYLREKYPDLKFVGTEPAIKLATNTNARDILVLATPGTVQSERAQKLSKENQKENQKVTLLPCPGLADTIEKNVRLTPDYQPLPLTNTARNVINQKLTEPLQPVDFFPDIIVLGCTHYSLIKPEIQAFFPHALLLDGGDGVASRVVSLVKSQAES